jgi:2-polyprenyl-3-methyl-5-hydroxy-6-metoxy-1,4-benzoquinol methylase
VEKKIVLAWLSRLGRTDLDIIEVGCGAAWLCPSLKQFGCVTATDLSDEVLARARARVPQVNFVAGDFMALEFGAEVYDVVVCLQVLAHVADQPAFIHKLAHLLRPGGLLMMATQNRPVLERYNPYPPRPGQLRRWTDRRELAALLADDFEVRELFGVAPRASRGLMRLVAGKAARRIMRRLTGDLWERALVRAGLGSNLMALARKRDAHDRDGRQDPR